MTGGFLGGSAVKNPFAMQELQEIWVRSLAGFDPLEEGTATYSNILAWRIPWTEEPGRLQSTDSQSRTRLSNFTLNMLSRLIIAFLPRSKCLLISWLQSPSAVILEPKEIKSVTVSIIFPSICYEVTGPDAMILVF